VKDKRYNRRTDGQHRCLKPIARQLFSTLFSFVSCVRHSL